MPCAVTASLEDARTAEGPILAGVSKAFQKWIISLWLDPKHHGLEHVLTSLTGTQTLLAMQGIPNSRSLVWSGGK